MKLSASDLESLLLDVVWLENDVHLQYMNHMTKNYYLNVVFQMKINKTCTTG